MDTCTITRAMQRKCMLRQLSTMCNVQSMSNSGFKPSRIRYTQRIERRITWQLPSPISELLAVGTPDLLQLLLDLTQARVAVLLDHVPRPVLLLLLHPSGRVPHQTHLISVPQPLDLPVPPDLGPPLLAVVPQHTCHSSPGQVELLTTPSSRSTGDMQEHHLHLPDQLRHGAALHRERDLPLL
eukprot:TRINITY_DN644_c0_g1_i2.p1 TRINITY_DN644_c0_g1~~TRINITY_DN644_c0_g1_i2.p1  ORF type:complete len:183 (-),score=16.52 TRINITY_DN644_c0_g1_i2:205-753(-)